VKRPLGSNSGHPWIEIFDVDVVPSSSADDSRNSTRLQVSFEFSGRSRRAILVLRIDRQCRGSRACLIGPLRPDR